MIAREISASAHDVAVSKPGTKVCRKFPVGISENNLIQGVVTESGGNRLNIRVVSAGRFPMQVGSIDVKPGAILTDHSESWAPCTW